MSRIKIGDTVKWRGAWGTEPAKDAVIVDIQICAKGRKEGRSVKSIAATTKDRCVFNFSNFHWAYGTHVDL